MAAKNDLTEHIDSHTHPVRTQPVTVALVAALILLAAAVTVLDLHIEHRQDVGNARQAHNVTAQQRLNDAQARLNLTFNATRRAQCFILARLAGDLRVHRPRVRRALQRAFVDAHCPQTIAHITHERVKPTPGATRTIVSPSPSPVPGPTTTVTVHPKHHRKPKHHRAPRPSPSCGLLTQPGACPPPIPVPSLRG